MAVLTAALAGVGTAVGALAVRAVLEPYRLVVEHHEAPIPNLGESWEGRRLALLSDLHVGMRGGNTATVRRAVQEVVRMRPVAALLAGDFIHDTERAIGPAVDLLRPLLEAGIPTYAVLGNHDYALPTRESQGKPELAEKLERELEAAGVLVLNNEVVAMEATGTAEPLFLVGIGPHSARDDRGTETLSKVGPDDPRVVLMHHPASYSALPAYTAPFAVAGHTHGGQVRLPFAPLLRYLTYMKEVEVVIAGWIRAGSIDGFGRAGNSLYVSRGIGCSVVPLRLFCPPEVTFFTLRRAG